MPRSRTEIAGVGPHPLGLVDTLVVSPWVLKIACP